MTTATLNDLRDKGLVEPMWGDLHLTNKGRDWLRLLSEVETTEVAESGEVAADLVMSTNGIFR